ncbi:MAG: ABC transporter substrate-binding protein [Thermodesulfobacteriota bacterium]
MHRVSVSGIALGLTATIILGLSGLVCPLCQAYNEAPILAKAVSDNQLPPVDKRLPAAPVVVKPVEKTGVYGGVWRRAYTKLSDLVGAQRILYDPLVRWSPDYKVIPNLAAAWDIEKDGRVFTFHLVKGVRWSDGHPFTADDILFYFEDILFNEELTSTIPEWIAPFGNRPKVSKIDEFTFRVEFDKPYSLFLDQLACPHGMHLVTKPKHYLMKFHKKYAKPEDLAALVKEKKSSSWVNLFHQLTEFRYALFQDPGYPSICAWVTKVPAPAKRFEMVRNPYYWKVDAEGNQLPYIDVLAHELTEGQNIVLKAIAGEIDMQGRRLGGMQNSVLLLANESRGQYKLVPKTGTSSVGVLLAPNINHTDPVMKQIISDRRFRIALSHAINREEINKIVYLGRGKPRQAAPLKESAFYSASYEKAYLAYKPEVSAALLDEMGLKKGPNGKRMRPDNKPLQIALDVSVDVSTQVDAAEIVASNLSAVGIDTEVKSETRDLFRQRIQNAAHDIAIWSGDGGLECLLEPRWYFPYNTESLNAPLYGQWFQSGAQSGLEPPPVIKEMMETYRQVVATVSPEKQKELFAKIIRANEENLWVIGLVYGPEDFYVVAKHFHNVPAKDFDSWIYPNPGPIRPEQFFVTKRSK